MLPTIQHHCCTFWDMRTCGMRVHLTSLTLILVITVSGQDGVREARQGCILSCFRSVIILMSTAGQLLSKHSSSNILICALYDAVYPRKKGKCRFLISQGGVPQRAAGLLGRDVKEVETTFNVFSPLFLSFCHAQLRACKNATCKN